MNVEELGAVSRAVKEQSLPPITANNGEEAYCIVVHPSIRSWLNWIVLRSCQKFRKRKQRRKHRRRR